MKKTVIIALVCVNVALLASLMLWATTPKANAQVLRGGADYLLMTGHIGSDWDAVYIIDMGSRRLLAWQFDKTKKRLVPIRGRQLKNDFRRRSEQD